MHLSKTKLLYAVFYLTLNMCYGYRRLGANYRLVKRIFGQTASKNQLFKFCSSAVKSFVKINLRLCLTLSDCP